MSDLAFNFDFDSDFFKRAREMANPNSGTSMQWNTNYSSSTKEHTLIHTTA